MKKYIMGFICGALFIGLIYLLKTYDVAAVGPDGTSVGFSTINQKIHEYTGVNMAWYDLTELIGYGAIGVCGFFGLAGLIQLIKRRSLLKVDRTLYALALLYIAVMGCYVLFEKLIINYRPVIMPGAAAPEASFPSSHTMLIIAVMASTSMVLNRYLKSGFLKAVIWLVCAAVICVTVWGRLICGVHWFTDILGGVLLSTTLLELFSGILHSARKADIARHNAEYAGAEGTIRFEEPAAVSSDAADDSGYIPKH